MNKLLHTPLTVHNVELANRLVMPPMATGKTPDGTVQDDLLAYYDARLLSLPESTASLSSCAPPRSPR